MITKDEVAYLHEFCKKKDIRYVDLRIELVDHLCELVQEVWDKHPELSFKDAFYQVYKRFGIFGFMEVAEEHEKTVQKRYWKEMWLFFKKWITPPRIVITASVTGIIYWGLASFDFLAMPMLILTALIFAASLATQTYQVLRNKKILNEQNILSGGARQGFFWFFYLLYMVVLNPIIANGEVSVYTNPWFITALFMVCVLFSRANYLLLEKAKGQLEGLKLKLA